MFKLDPDKSTFFSWQLEVEIFKWTESLLDNFNLKPSSENPFKVEFERQAET